MIQAGGNHGDTLEIAIGGSIGDGVLDAIIETAMLSSGWFAESDQRISDLVLDLGIVSVIEMAVDEIGEDGLLAIVLGRPASDPELSVAAKCRELGVAHVVRRCSLDADRVDVATYWLPGMIADAPLDAPAASVVPAFVPRFGSLAGVGEVPHAARPGSDD